MRFELQKMPIGLAAGTSLNIDDASGATLRVVRGRVWITQEGSVDDLFLDAGAGHTFREDGRVVVSSECTPGGTATIVFDAPLSVVARESFGHMLGRLLTFRPAPRSIATNAYEGI